MAQFRSGWGSEEHPRFLSYIRARWLVRRSRGPVSVSPRVRGNDYSEVGQSAFVDKVGKIRLSVCVCVCVCMCMCVLCVSACVRVLACVCVK